MNENVVGVMKNKLGKKIMEKFVRLRPKTYSYLIDDSSEDKKAKGTKQCIKKKNLIWKIIKTASKKKDLEKFT